MPSIDNFREGLLRRSWQFARQDGKVLADELRLLPNGRIGNYHHSDGHHWRMKNGALEFLRADDTITTRFDRASYPEPGALELIGEALTVPRQPHTYHVLRSKHTCTNARQAPRIAALIRTHLVNPKVHHLIESLQGSTFYDLYILADESRVRLAIPGVPVLPHNLRMCASLGLSIHPANHPNVFWLCGDYPLYCAHQFLADYDLFILLEYDVHFVRENPSFLEKLLQHICAKGETLDFVGSTLRPGTAQSRWYEAAARLYETVYWSGIFSLIVVSRRALHFLIEERLREARHPEAHGEVIHCETFALTALKGNDAFRCSSIDALMPGSISARSYHPSYADMAKPNYLLGRRADPDPCVEIVHPVLDAEQYLARLWTCCLANGGPRRFLKHLHRIEFTLVPLSLRTQYEAFAAEALQQEVT